MKIKTEFKLEATPERIYAVLKLIDYKAYTRDEIIDLINPISKEDGCGIVLNYLSECGIIEEDYGRKYKLKIDSVHVSSIEHFRKWVNTMIFIQDTSDTFNFTKWYMAQDTGLLNKTAKQLLKDTPHLIKSERDMNAWRLWSRFIGLGTLHNGHFIPNPAIRIKDVIEVNELFVKGKNIPIGEFIKSLLSVCPDLSESIQDHYIRPFLSLGLRTLNQDGVIQLAYHQDYTEIWYLAESSIYNDAAVTHITIGGTSHE